MDVIENSAQVLYYLMITVAYNSWENRDLLLEIKRDIGSFTMPCF